jgi:UDP-glucose:(heptosyl)LPS alpha-1,3-glucosyltransferase
LHTTGAVVINRVDVSTVHYCHRAAKARLTGSRAARSNRAYRLNAWLAGAMSRAAEAWCYRPARTRVLCAVSQGVATELGEQFPGMRGAIRAIPNGVDANRFAPDSAVRDRVRAEFGIQQQEAVALFAGGDWERKGLIHAVGALENAPQWRLLVAGPGDPTPVLAAARSVGTEPRVQFLGPVSDMPSLYAAADAFVLPTSYEAFPLVVLEAAASALPLLVTRVNGVEEALDDGRNGWFVDRRADDIARRLNELAADRPLATAMAAAARKAALAYSWGSMAEQYLSLYAELGLSPD